MRQSTFTGKLIISVLLVTAASATQAQTRIAYISMTELIQAMPEFKKADSSLTNYKEALSERYDNMVREFNEKDSTLSGPETTKMTAEQIDVRKREAADLYSQIQRFSQQINPLLQQRQDQLLAPIRKKANDLIWLLAKEHGYTYVLLKETIAVYPLSDDLMPYAKVKLGLK